MLQACEEFLIDGRNCIQQMVQYLQLIFWLKYQYYYLYELSIILDRFGLDLPKTNELGCDCRSNSVTLIVII